MNKLNTILMLLVLALSCVGCQSPSEEEKKVDNEAFVVIKKVQFESENMKLGQTERIAFENVVPSTGLVLAQNNGRASVGLMVGGVVKQIFVNRGQHIEKGQALMEVGGNAILDLQREMADSWASLEQLSVDYQRISTLYDKELQTQKEYLAIRSQYRSETAHYNTLKLKLAGVHMDTTKIKNGRFTSTYRVLAPISGDITDMSVSIGEYFDSEDALMEIINPDRLWLQLAVFENHIDEVAVGQKVRLYSSESDSLTGWAALSSVSSALNKNNKAVNCYAEFQPGNKGQYLNNQFLRAEIITQSDSVDVLPVSAIAMEAHQGYVLVLVKEDEQSYFFDRRDVVTGRSNGRVVEVPEDLKGQRLLLEGLYNLQL